MYVISWLKLRFLSILLFINVDNLVISLYRVHKLNRFEHNLILIFVSPNTGCFFIGKTLSVFQPRVKYEFFIRLLNYKVQYSCAMKTWHISNNSDDSRRDLRVFFRLRNTRTSIYQSRVNFSIGSLDATCFYMTSTDYKFLHILI